MATLATTTIAFGGTAEVLTAAAGGGDACETGDNVYLKVVNGGGSPITVTLVIPAANKYRGATITAGGGSVTNGQHRWFQIDPVLYTDPTTKLCTITYSAVTSVTVGAHKFPRSF